MITRKSLFKYTPRVVAAFILLQTLWFKFGIGGNTALRESKIIFVHLSQSLLDTGQYEGLFRLGTGMAELLVSIALFTRYAGYGALLGVVIMLGAILSHLLLIGISINGDHGQLMVMAVIVLICCVKVAFNERNNTVLKRFI
ncbi:DoxX family protein [Reichenbachiella agariperforans]|uniref:DoxX family protein n=1 Tax=Reichenbachiella agariperforans TaxID=156994 RepID=UPI001C09D574|nr:DoxX family protein [Reichenbachiella agariperforans]MBU2913084.1 DoxX family protein [Reichenbachiella agariperforans]